MNVAMEPFRSLQPVLMLARGRDGSDTDVANIGMRWPATDQSVERREEVVGIIPGQEVGGV